MRLDNIKLCFSLAGIQKQKVNIVFNLSRHASLAGAWSLGHPACNPTNRSLTLTKLYNTKLLSIKLKMGINVDIQHHPQITDNFTGYV